ncbi:MAG: aminotransferase class I/II-fold pyridoxal phosphate-dependent enzyme [Treponema sp.]|nr:aminotransferase class I/II-fold pyridoxal phosphate-dependent enzyme [Treponema sp.]
MNNLARELNMALEGTVAGRLLSQLGRRLYFPNGIIAQSAEAKKTAHRANATIGMAYSGGQPMILSAIAESMPSLSAEAAVAYAPTAGLEQAREAWKDLVLQKNPSVNTSRISLPVVIPGLTAGLSYAADLFLEAGRTILTSDPCWDNYDLIFAGRREAVLQGIPFFGNGSPGRTMASGLDMETIAHAVRESAKTGAVRLIFNFPNNPSGYSPTRPETDTLVQCIREAAEGGADVLVICDDAYFGLFYEEEINKESLFSRFASLHERILAIKIDGHIKEDYGWGLRMGFLTFGSLGLEPKHHEALVKKMMGAIRSSVSCANTPAQHFMLKAMEDPRTGVEKDRYYEILRRRYRAVKDFIGENPGHPRLKPLPFNSGYFMSFRCVGIDAEVLRRELLYREGIGTVALNADYLRIAFAGMEEEQISGVYRIIYDTALKL